jgi:hypothetical protein
MTYVPRNLDRKPLIRLLTKYLKKHRPEGMFLKAFARQNAYDVIHKPHRSTLEKAAWEFLLRKHGRARAEAIVNERTILQMTAEFH